jgi:hypothetical protein
MMMVEANTVEAIEEFPMLKKWIKKITKLGLQERTEKISTENVSVYYSYGFFVGKSQNTEEALRESFEDTSKMLFGKRLSHEMKKVRVYITLKYKDFTLTDKLPKNEIPEMIRKIVAEIVKVKMSVEFEYHQNKDVFDSIPDADRSIAQIEVKRKSTLEQSESEETILDLDSILDKISKYGIESITEEEKRFLDKKSRGN